MIEAELPSVAPAQVGYGGNARAGGAIMTRRQAAITAKASGADEDGGSDELAKQRLTHAVRSSARTKATKNDDDLQALLLP